MRDRDERSPRREGKERGELKMKTLQTASRNQLFLLLSYAMHTRDDKTIELILDEVKQRNFLRRR